MTTSKWLLVGLTMGFLASAVSCGDPDTCTATSCPTGCCNADNKCVDNVNTLQCGARGNQCVACGFGQVCTQGLCSTGTNGGGSGGTTGGGSGSTGGGSGSNPTCTQLGAAEATFFAGKSACEYAFDGGTASFSASNSAVSGCNTVMSNAACSTTDRTKMPAYVSCLQAAPACTTGNEQAAVTSVLACAQTLYTGLSQACQTALSSPTGGGTGNTGGGSGSTGGGSGSTGGGSGSTGGGSGSTGGGSGSTGGGSGSTGGGSGSTGGGSGSTGGGSGNNCGSAVASQSTFFAGRSSCPSSSGTLNPITNLQTICTSTCSANDQPLLAAMGTCTASVPCTAGNENAAYSQYQTCAGDYLFSLTTACSNALLAASSTGGGTGTTGGGTGTTGGGTGTTGGGSGSCTTISLGTFGQGAVSGGVTIYTADPIGTSLGNTTLDDFAQLRFTSTSTGTFAFSTSALNIASCPRCLLLGQDPSASTGAPAKVYAANGGTITITGNSPVTGPLSASVSNVTMVEGTLDGSGNFTATSGGACLNVINASISAAAPPNIPGWTCNTDWYGDGSCDCGCGAKDSDCTSTTSVSECAWCVACGQSVQNACSGYVSTTNTTQCL